MQIIKKPMDWFIEKMKNGEYFRLAGYSDAEWYCIMHRRIGEKTGLGQVLSSEHGEILWDIILRRHTDENFMFAVPRVLYSLPEFDDGSIDWVLGSRNIKMVAYERDMLTDTLAENAELYPLISQLRKMRVVILGNSSLRGLDFLNAVGFVEISSPNLHLEEKGIKNAVNSALEYPEGVIYLVSAGVSAAVIIDRIYEVRKKCWLMDCGSIWDAFVGAGGQRAWREELYANPQKLKKWITKNLTGV